MLAWSVEEPPRKARIEIIPMIDMMMFLLVFFVLHTYYDHASILKFIERNWAMKPLSNRSRDNFPNPVHDKASPYVPKNRPAIGDLMNLIQE